MAADPHFDQRPMVALNARAATQRSYVMCRPSHFAVRTRLNVWMDPSVPVDVGRAIAQWEGLVAAYRELGHEVHEIEPVPGLPDLVFAANGAFTVDGIAYLARFAHPERAPEAALHREFLLGHGFQVVEPSAVNEGEGDFVLVGSRILAGTGYRTEVNSHRELAEITGREVITLPLVSPLHYHLDTALMVLDPVVDDVEANIAYVERAFDDRGRGVLRELYPDAIRVTDADADVFALNSVSDGRTVLVPGQASTAFRAALTDRGYVPRAVDLSELLLGGGGIKCCTQELRV